MKKLFKLIYKNLAELMTIAGSGIFAYNIFDFGYRYDSETLSLIAIGIMLIVTGVILIRKK